MQGCFVSSILAWECKRHVLGACTVFPPCLATVPVLLVSETLLLRRQNMFSASNHSGLSSERKPQHFQACARPFFGSISCQCRPLAQLLVVQNAATLPQGLYGHMPTWLLSNVGTAAAIRRSMSKYSPRGTSGAHPQEYRFVLCL